MKGLVGLTRTINRKFKIIGKLLCVYVCKIVAYMLRIDISRE